MSERSAGNRSLRIVLRFTAVAILGFLFFSFWKANTTVIAQFGLPAEGLGWVQRARLTLNLYRQKDLLTTAAPAEGESRKFSVEPDENVRIICARLESEGFVLSGPAVCDYLVYTGSDRYLQSGTFTLRSGLNTVEVADRLSNPEARDIVLSIFPGWRLEEIAAQIANLGFSFEGEEFLTITLNPPQALQEMLGLTAGQSLEGFFLPGTYSFEPEISAQEAVTSVLRTFVAKTQGLAVSERVTAAGLDFYDVVILASIIQRETTDAGEMPLIASVFYNRLATGMKLETDPTVQYALGFDAQAATWWQSPLDYTDLQVDSPFNTYRYGGLPPGPISNPGLEALTAAAQPAESPYYYFRARCDGSGTHDFSETYEEHLGKGCE